MSEHFYRCFKFILHSITVTYNTAITATYNTTKLINNHPLKFIFKTNLTKSKDFKEEIVFMEEFNLILINLIILILFDII